MKQAVHPIRDVELVVFSNPDHGAIGFFGLDGKFPVYIKGRTPEEVVEKGEEFRESMLSKYEEEYIRRKEQAARATAARMRKKRKKE